MVLLLVMSYGKGRAKNTNNGVSSKLNQTAFNIQTSKKADLSICDGKDIPVAERLKPSLYHDCPKFSF